MIKCDSFRWAAVVVACANRRDTHSVHERKSGNCCVHNNNQKRNRLQSNNIAPEKKHTLANAQCSRRQQQKGIHCFFLLLFSIRFLLQIFVVFFFDALTRAARGGFFWLSATFVLFSFITAYWSRRLSLSLSVLFTPAGSVRIAFVFFRMPRKCTKHLFRSKSQVVYSTRMRVRVRVRVCVGLSMENA